MAATFLAGENRRDSLRAAAPKVKAGARAAVMAVARALRPAVPVLRNAAQIPLTILGWGFIDAGVYTINLTAGLIATGITLMIVEHQLADGD